ncbi:MAG: hypothetical protein BWY31_02241 [Lentisphaerae bacterium ADurb.Bin242]|nr:MAG: hypothetical protein BWY31_02241 [Lentisphaerae bacterium ADurb.Bin242]
MFVDFLAGIVETLRKPERTVGFVGRATEFGMIVPQGCVHDIFRFGSPVHIVHAHGDPHFDVFFAAVFIADLVRVFHIPEKFAGAKAQRLDVMPERHSDFPAPEITFAVNLFGKSLPDRIKGFTVEHGTHRIRVEKNAPDTLRCIVIDLPAKSRLIHAQFAADGGMIELRHYVLELEVHEEIGKVIVDENSTHKKFLSGFTQYISRILPFQTG